MVSECSTRSFNQVTDVNTYSQGTSGLMLGMAAWAYGSTGLSPGIASGYYSILNMSPNWISSLVPTFSDKFIIDAVSKGVRGIGSIEAANNDYNVDTLIPLITGLAGSNRSSLNNLTVPFWYVMAVLSKFNISLDTKIKRQPRRFTGGLAAQGRKMAYSFDEKSPWYTLYLAQSDMAYESRHWDQAGVLTQDAALGRVEISWYPDLHIDQSRYLTSEQIFGMVYNLNNPGTLQITMSGGDYLQQYHDCTALDVGWRRDIIWGNTATETDRPSSWPVVIGGLQYPDPFWDWLWEGAQKVGPHLLMGNYGSAAAETFQHLAKPAAEWAGEKIKQWVDQRSA